MVITSPTHGDIVTFGAMPLQQLAGAMMSNAAETLEGQPETALPSLSRWLMRMVQGGVKEEEEEEGGGAPG
jgi:hypothetical protein